jgi:DNA-directed RNA polymerase subunit RPC12/RpoP
MPIRRGGGAPDQPMRVKDCVLVQIEPELARCSRCGREVRSKKPAGSLRAVCEAGDCTHLGDELRRVECPTCYGRVQVKVRACHVHVECTVQKQLDGVARCATCPDWAAASDSPPQNT